MTVCSTRTRLELRSPKSVRIHRASVWVWDRTEAVECSDRTDHHHRVQWSVDLTRTSERVTRSLSSRAVSLRETNGPVMARDTAAACRTRRRDTTISSQADHHRVVTVDSVADRDRWVSLDSRRVRVVARKATRQGPAATGTTTEAIQWTKVFIAFSK